MVKDRRINKLYIGIFIALAASFVIMPLMGDDMTFSAITKGKGIGEIFSYAMSYGNGRLLGNSFILILLKSDLLRGLVKALVLTGIVGLTARLCEVKTFGGIILTAFLVLFTGNSFIAQAYAWSAGFTNYTIPVLFILIILTIVKSGKKAGAISILQYAGILILGIASQLFSENTTVFNVVLAAFVLFIAIHGRKRAELGIRITYLVSTIIGAVLMYIIPRVSQTADNMDWYRSSALESEKSVIQIALGNLTQIFYDVSQLMVLWFVLSICIITLIRSNEQLPSHKKRSRNILFGVLCAYPVLILTSITLYDYINIVEDMFSLTVMLATIVYLVVVLVAICKWLPSELRKTSLVLFILTVVSLAPLLVVEPIGIRTYYLSFIIMVCLALYLAKAAAKHLIPEMHMAFISKAACVALSVSLLVTFAVYTDAAYCNYYRDKYIREQMEAEETVIHIPPIRHSQLVFNGDKIYKTEGLPSLYYYDEPGDIEFVLEDDFDEWNSKYNKKSVRQEDETQQTEPEQ